MTLNLQRDRNGIMSLEMRPYFDLLISRVLLRKAIPFPHQIRTC